MSEAVTNPAERPLRIPDTRQAVTASVIMALAVGGGVARASDSQSVLPAAGRSISGSSVSRI